jgi:hypothetical protein
MVKIKARLMMIISKRLAKIFKSTNDEAKRQGIITDYKSWPAMPQHNRITIFC